jgi:inosine-uridine nucleoside N-ribohydrolase
MALRMEPELCRRALSKIVWMGGAAFAGGNASQWAEANAAYDPEATHILLTSEVEVVMYTWDVYLQVEYSRQELCSLRVATAARPGSSDQQGKDDAPAVESPDLTGWAELSTRLLLRDMQHWASPAAQIGDAGAVAIVIAGEQSYQSRPMHVAVEMHGTVTRGMTAVDPRPMATEPDRQIAPPNATVLLSVDAEVLKTIFSDAVLQPPSGQAVDTPKL